MKTIIRSIALTALVVSPFSQSGSAQVFSRDDSASAHIRSYNTQTADPVSKNKVETAQVGHSNNAQLAQVGLTSNARPALVGGISPSSMVEGVTLQQITSVIIRGFPFFPRIPF